MTTTPTPAATVEARRLVLLLELEQLSEADLLELSDFLAQLLRTPRPGPPRDALRQAVSVRAAYAFGDWPPRLAPLAP